MHDVFITTPALPSLRLLVQSITRTCTFVFVHLDGKVEIYSCCIELDLIGRGEGGSGAGSSAELEAKGVTVHGEVMMKDVVLSLFYSPADLQWIST